MGGWGGGFGSQGCESPRADRCRASARASWPPTDTLFLAGVGDAKGQVYSFAPNALGWTESETHGGGTRRSTYDVNGNVKSVTNRRGQTVTFTYDELDQLRSRTADGQTATFSTAPNGRMQTASNAASTDTLKYDAAGRLTQQISRGYELVSSYDAWNRRTAVQMVRPFANSVSYGYNAAGQLSTLTGLDGGVTRIDYNADRQPYQTTLPTGLVITEAYLSNHGRLGIEYDVPALDDALGMNYSQTPKGLLRERFNVAGDRRASYGYDKAGRLSTWTDEQVTAAQACAGGMVIDHDTGMQCAFPEERNVLASGVYSYDKVGNRTDRGAQYQPGELNRLTSFGDWTLGYDADGNLTRKAKPDGSWVQTFTWNALGQMVSVSTPGVGTTSFQYDGFGRRTARREPGRNHYYLYDGDQVVWEGSDAGDEAEFTYYPGVDDPHSMRRRRDNARIFYYATEEPGHVTGLVDGAHRLVNRYTYTPWGELRPESMEAEYNPFGFGGRERDAETGLVFLRARSYDPQTGRFLSEDPIGLSGGINLYTYAANNPVNYTDPFGLDDCEAMLQAAGTEKDKAEDFCNKQSLPPIVATAPRGSGPEPAGEPAGDGAFRAGSE